MGSAHRGRFVAALAVVVVLLASSCTTGSTETSTSSSLGTTTSTASATSTTTTSVATTTTTTTLATTTTSTTLPPTTTTTQDPPPSTVHGLTVGIGGGSGEVIPEWDRGSEADLDHYNVWYSEASGAAKALLAAVDHDPNSIGPPAYDAGSGRTAYVDFPRDQDEGTQCYQISAVDSGGNESSRTSEVCLPVIPPDAVTGFLVDIGGGSGEVFLRWSRGSDPAIDHYNLWYSEFPSQAKSLLDAVPRDPADLSSPAYDYGSGTTAYIDFPRDLANDKQCYQISAVDALGNEGVRTTELCLSGL